MAMIALIYGEVFARFGLAPRKAINFWKDHWLKDFPDLIQIVTRTIIEEEMSLSLCM